MEITPFRQRQPPSRSTGKQNHEKKKEKKKKTKCAGPRRKPITQESLATRRYLATLYEGLRKGRQPGIANERKRSPSRTYCKSLSHTTSRTEYRIAFAQPLALGNEFVIGCCGVARRNDSLNEETYQMSAANPFLRLISAFCFSEAVYRKSFRKTPCGDPRRSRLRSFAD